MRDKLKLLERKKDCALLKYSDRERYIVQDCENTSICITNDYETAKREYDSYDIEKVRTEMYRNFEKWLEDNTL